MSFLRRTWSQWTLIAVAALLQVVPLPPSWIEGAYANGIYARAARTFVPLANAFPWAAGDFMLLAAMGGLGYAWIRGWRRSRAPAWQRIVRIALQTGAAIAFTLIWFDAAWALNYRRAPVAQRVDFDPARVTPGAVARLSRRIVDGLNRTAPLVHGRNESEPAMETALRAAFAPVARRLGDRYDVIVSRPKVSAFDRWFAIAGIGGTWDPFAYETLLNGEFLPFERPFALAHEWGHVAGFGDESDANLIALLTTLRSSDPFVRYSGLFWAYGFLPDADRRRLPLSPLVIGDLRAARERFLRHYNPQLYALQWFWYDKYLRANRVSAGVVSYTLFVQVLAGTRLDAAGLPRLRRAPNQGPATRRGGSAQSRVYGGRFIANRQYEADER